MSKLASPDKRNGYIELIRLSLAYMIAIMHYNGGVPGAYLGLEVFFMISGFYQMKTMKQTSHGDFAPIKYTVVRFLKLFFIYESSILILAFFDEGYFGLDLFAKRMFICIPDMLCLQMTGLFDVRINPELWYVSAMMTAGLFLALLYCMSSRVFYCSLPLITVLAYSLLYSRYGSLGINHLVRDLPFPSGTIRGLAGMSSGCLLYLAHEHLMQIRHSPKKTFILSGLFLISSLLCTICFFFKYNSYYDYYILLSAAVMLLCAMSGETYLSPYMNKLGQIINSVLGKQFSFGIVAYTAVTLIAGSMFIPYDKFSGASGLLIFLVLLSLLSFIGAKLADWFNSRFINKLIKTITTGFKPQ